jgi:hypothetical protein
VSRALLPCIPAFPSVEFSRSNVWNPRPATRLLLEQVAAILDECADYLPLTLRQIFYRLVGVHDYEKTKRAYERLGEALNKARRARLIPMDAIRDDGGATEEPWAHNSPGFRSPSRLPRPRKEPPGL